MWPRNYFSIDHLLSNDKTSSGLKNDRHQRDYQQCVPSNVELFNQVFGSAAKASHNFDSPYQMAPPCHPMSSDVLPFWLFLPQYLQMQRSLSMWSPPRSPDSSGESAPGIHKNTDTFERFFSQNFPQKWLNAKQIQILYTFSQIFKSFAHFIS